MRTQIPVPVSAALAFALALTCLPRPAAAATKDSVVVGQPAPAFTLPDQTGKPISPKDFSGQWLVLYFYPKDFTSGCTVEAHNFQRDSAKYAAADAVILGVSLDTPGSHQDFCAKEGLRFKLLADSGGVVSARYGSLKSYVVKRLSARNTFLIDPQGKVARIFLGVSPAKHSEEVLAALAELRKTAAPAPKTAP